MTLESMQKKIFIPPYITGNLLQDFHLVKIGISENDQATFNGFSQLSMMGEIHVLHKSWQAYCQIAQLPFNVMQNLYQIKMKILFKGIIVHLIFNVNCTSTGKVLFDFLMLSID